MIALDTGADGKGAAAGPIGAVTPKLPKGATAFHRPPDLNFGGDADDAPELRDTLVNGSADVRGLEAAFAFFRLVWPAVGIFCLAIRRFSSRTGEPWWDHETYTCRRAAAVRAVELATSLDVYFAIGTLRKARIWNEAEKRWSFRKQSNIAGLKCLFLDLDCGKDKHGRDKDYASQREAGEALMRFLQRVPLPRPHVVDSGYGLHIYWVLDEALPAADWHAFALKFHARVAEYGLKVDRMRTLDRASVLRVPGTLNHKYGTTRAVRIMTPAEVARWWPS